MAKSIPYCSSLVFFLPAVFIFIEQGKPQYLLKSKDGHSRQGNVP